MSTASQIKPASYSLIIDGKKRVFRHVDVHTKTRFEARYKGFDISVYLDVEEDEDEDDCAPEECRYYILVCNPEISFGTAYDGWAPEEADTLEKAIVEALRGSQLL